MIFCFYKIITEISNKIFYYKKSLVNLYFWGELSCFWGELSCLGRIELFWGELSCFCFMVRKIFYTVIFLLLKW
jgi:hypothetical protein